MLAVRVLPFSCVAYCTVPSQMAELGVKPVPLTVTVAVPVGSGFGVTDVIMGPLETNCALTVVLAAGMVSVVEAELALATAAPDQLWKRCPEGGVLALMLTVAPAA